MDARRRLLDAARVRIETRRYPVPVRTLAAEAGIAVSTIYSTLANRDAIANAVVDELLADDAQDHPAVDLHAYLRAMVEQRATRMATHRELVLGLLALPETWSRISHRAALHEPAFARFVGVLEGHREELVGEPAVVASFAAVSLRGVLLGAVEERPQYLTDPAFIAECVAVIEHIVLREPQPFIRAHASSHEHAFARTATPSALRKEPVQGRSRELVENIIDGTLRVVERDGVDAITTPRVAKAAGVSVGSIYQYFDNKRSLMGALMDRWMKRDLGFTAQRLAEETSGSAAVLLDNLAREWHVRMTDLARLYRGLFVVFPRMERAAAVRDFLALSRELTLREIVKRDDANGIDCALMVFVLGHVIIALCRALATDRPELLGSDALASTFHRLAYASIVDRVPALPNASALSQRQK